MKYLNFILTLISLLLIIMILQNNRPIISQATTVIQDVNLKQIAGVNLFDKVLEIKSR